MWTTPEDFAQSQGPATGLMLNPHFPLNLRDSVQVFQPELTSVSPPAKSSLGEGSP